MHRPRITLSQIFVWTSLYGLLLAFFLVVPTTLLAAGGGSAVLTLLAIGDAFRSERSQRDVVMSISYCTFALAAAFAIAFALVLILPPEPPATTPSGNWFKDSWRNLFVGLGWALLILFANGLAIVGCSTVSCFTAIARWRRYRLAKSLAIVNAPSVAFLAYVIVAIAIEGLG